MAEVESFKLVARLQALVTDYLDPDGRPDVQNVSSSIRFIPRLPNGKIAWAPGLDIPAGIVLSTIRARTDTDGFLRTIHLQPINEIQKIVMSGSSATISFNGSPTVTINNGMTNLAVKAALESLPTIGTGNIGVSGETGTYTVTFVNNLGNQGVPQMVASGATVTTTREGTANDGVELVANTPVLDLDELIYDVVFDNVVFDRSIQILDAFAFVAPTTAGITLDLASVPKLDPKPGI